MWTAKSKGQTCRAQPDKTCLSLAGSRQSLPSCPCTIHTCSSVCRRNGTCHQVGTVCAQERGVGESALRGRSRTARVPEWLEKWAALIMEYVETEQALLPRELLALRPPYATYTPASAAAEAKGVSDNRLQNVVITLDKLKLCLERPGTSAIAPALLACLCPQPHLHMLCTHVGSASFPKPAQHCVWHTVA